MRVLAYVYPGWHSTPERDASFHPGFTEWELVRACRPRFDGHPQPRLPLLGEYDDRDPREVERRLRPALEHGIDAFVYGLFWCRGKRVFEDALDQGFLGCELGRATPFAVMWANRLPRRVLPVKRADRPVIEDDRRVPSDVEDFVELIAMVAERYMSRPNYLSVGGRAYFSIYDSTFFLRELGVDAAREAVQRARDWLHEHGHPELHLAAIEPSPEVIGDLRQFGFDSVTHYVHLPVWKGPLQQDYAECALDRSTEWEGFARASGLPYFPSVAPGWDASPRGADFGTKRPDRYPWSPVVTGEHPQRFAEALRRAVGWSRDRHGAERAMVFVASLNEWSEGHYLEPDERFGTGWLEALREAVARERPDR